MSMTTFKARVALSALGGVVTMPWYDGEDGRLLRVSRLVVIAKSDGRVLFDGSAGDEG